LRRRATSRQEGSRKKCSCHEKEGVNKREKVDDGNPDKKWLAFGKKGLRDHPRGRGREPAGKGRPKDEIPERTFNGSKRASEEEPFVNSGGGGVERKGGRSLPSAAKSRQKDGPTCSSAVKKLKLFWVVFWGLVLCYFLCFVFVSTSKVSRGGGKTPDGQKKRGDDEPPEKIREAGKKRNQLRKSEKSRLRRLEKKGDYQLRNGLNGEGEKKKTKN